MKSLAALGQAGMDDELARDVIERPQHRDLLGLPRRRHSQVRTALGPCARQIRVCQGLALVAIKENDVAGLGLGLAQLEAQPDALDLAGALAAFQRVAGPPPAEFFFRSALDSCDLPILTPSRASISAMRRGMVQLGGRRREFRAEARRHAPRLRSLPVTGRAQRSPSTPRHRRARTRCAKDAVSSRTLKASAMRGLVHPDNVSNIARARSASPRSREWANVSSALRCWSPAVTRDLPATPRLRESTRRSNHTRDSLVKLREFA